MQHAAFPAHRHVDGGIDYQLYRADAARLRAEARMGFLRGIGRWLRDQRRMLTAPAPHPGNAEALYRGK